mgnify:CR=1 FL=1
MPSSTAVEASLPIRSEMDLAWVRGHVRQAAGLLGFGLVAQTKLVTAASELARNTLVHGGGRRVDPAQGTRGPARRPRPGLSDEGPGTSDT